MNLATLVIGPLLEPECRRASRRGMVFINRGLVGVLYGVIVVGAFGYWFLMQSVTPFFLPDFLPGITWLLANLAVATALLACPSALAGSLAGERERGSIGLLLSSRVDAREIVLGRLFSKLSIVGLSILGGVPFLLLFGWLCDFSVWQQFTLLMIPVSVGFGSGGLAIAASAVAKRGRNALIAVYFLELAFLVASNLGSTWTFGGMLSFFTWMNPFLAVSTLTAGLGTAPAWVVIASWTFLGVVGATLAAWRLRPAFLGDVSGKGKKSGRPWRVPPINETSPMLWKEIHIERVNALGWFGRILGWIVVLYLGVGSLLLGGTALAVEIFHPDLVTYPAIVNLADDMYGGWAAFFVSLLISLAVGLRAAVAISSERERGTWDALLTSPLSGREILWGKLWGSLHSLRWLLTATLISWIVSVLLSAMSIWAMLAFLAITIAASVFIGTLGVFCSLSSATATKAMTVTVGWWLGAYAAFSIASGVISLFIMAAWFLVLLMINSIAGSLTGRALMPPGALFPVGFTIVLVLEFVGFSAILITGSWIRFDTVAGRIPADGAAPAGLVLVETGRSDSPAANGDAIAKADEVFLVPANAEVV